MSGRKYRYEVRVRNLITRQGEVSETKHTYYDVIDRVSGRIMTTLPTQAEALETAQRLERRKGDWGNGEIHV